MAVGDLAIVQQGHAVFEHGVGFGGKSGDNIRPDCDLGASFLQALRQSNRLRPAVPSLHAFEDHIITRLKRKVDMGHHARFASDQIKQAVINFNRIER